MRTIHFAAPVAVAALLVALGGPSRAQSSPGDDGLANQLRFTAGSLAKSKQKGVRPAALYQADKPAKPAGTPAATRVSTTVAPAPPGAADTSAPEAPSANLYVQFATGSATLTPMAAATLDRLGRVLSSGEFSADHFRIEGHTDTVGSKALNQALSERRAAAVADYVARKFGVDGSRLAAIGMGSDKLLIATPDQTAEPRNRRVQVVNLGP